MTCRLQTSWRSSGPSFAEVGCQAGAPPQAHHTCRSHNARAADVQHRPRSPPVLLPPSPSSTLRVCDIPCWASWRPKCLTSKAFQGAARAFMHPRQPAPSAAPPSAAAVAVAAAFLGQAPGSANAASSGIHEQLPPPRREPDGVSHSSGSAYAPPPCQLRGKYPSNSCRCRQRRPSSIQRGSPIGKRSATDWRRPWDASKAVHGTLASPSPMGTLQVLSSVS